MRRFIMVVLFGVVVLATSLFYGRLLQSLDLDTFFHIQAGTGSINVQFMADVCQEEGCHE